MSGSVVKIIVFAALVASGAPAVAQTAEELADQAVTAYDAGEYVRAAELLQQAQQTNDASYLKLNEMTAWYRADRCDDALAARAKVRTGAPDLEPRDFDDMNKVHADCNYRRARTLFDAGDLDGAEAALEGLQTRDGGITAGIDALRREIKFKRQELAAPKEPTVIVVEAPPTPAPRPPVPRWVLWTGIGAISASIAFATWVIVKWRVERGQYATGLNLIAPRFNCYYNENRQLEALMDGAQCRDEELYADEKYKAWRREEVDPREVENVAIGTAAGVFGAAGIGFLGYYLIKTLTAERSEASLLPIAGNGYAGALLEVRF